MENLSTVIICVILGLICVYAVINYAKRIKGGCCGSGDSEIKIKPSDTNIKNYSHKTEVFINGMTCNHCKLRIENAFNDIDGLYAKVNLNKKVASVYSKTAPDIEFYREIVERSGYEFVKAEIKQ